MANDNAELANHIAISPNVLYLLLSAALAAGAGGYGILGPRIESQAIEACFDNSESATELAQTALDVAAQHGQELVDLRNLIAERARDRYTGAQARNDWREQEKIDTTQDRRIELLERESRAK